MISATRERLLAIVAELDSLSFIKDDDEGEPVSIVVETSEDEAIAAGTLSGFVRFASELLAAVENCYSDEASRMQINSEAYRCSTFGASLNKTGDIVIRSIVVAEDDEGLRSIVDSFQEG